MGGLQLWASFGPSQIVGISGSSWSLLLWPDETLKTPDKQATSAHCTSLVTEFCCQTRLPVLSRQIRDVEHATCYFEEGCAFSCSLLTNELVPLFDECLFAFELPFCIEWCQVCWRVDSFVRAWTNLDSFVGIRALFKELRFGCGASGRAGIGQDQEFWHTPKIPEQEIRGGINFCLPKCKFKFKFNGIMAIFWKAEVDSPTYSDPRLSSGPCVRERFCTIPSFSTKDEVDTCFNCEEFQRQHSATQECRNNFVWMVSNWKKFCFISSPANLGFV